MQTQSTCPCFGWREGRLVAVVFVPPLLHFDWTAWYEDTFKIWLSSFSKQHLQKWEFRINQSRWFIIDKMDFRSVTFSLDGNYIASGKTFGLDFTDLQRNSRWFALERLQRLREKNRPGLQPQSTSSGKTSPGQIARLPTKQLRNNPLTVAQAEESGAGYYKILYGWCRTNNNEINIQSFWVWETNQH